MRYARRSALVLVSVLIAGCGGPARHYGVHGAATPHQCGAALKPGQGHMGACIPSDLKTKPVSKLTVGGAFGIDVSSYQHCAPFSGARFVVAKAGEGSGFTDRTLGCHIAEARRLGIPWGAYYFQRSGDQVFQAQRFVRLLAPYGAPPIGFTIDSEVGVSTPETCLFARVLFSLTHRIPVIYTSPGLWPGGGSCGAFLWVADYASHFVIPHGFTRALAWQSSDGQFGPFPHCVGGICGDIDRDFGLVAAERPAPKPKPHVICFGAHAQHSALCRKVQAEVAHFRAAEAASARVYARHGCPALVARDAYFARQLKAHPAQRRAHRLGALAATRRAERRGDCPRLGQRTRYFAGRAAQTIKSY